MKWEYKAIRLTGSFNDGANLTEALNAFGKESWELISSDLGQSCFVFKRPELSNEVNERVAIEGYFGGKVG